MIRCSSLRQQLTRMMVLVGLIVLILSLFFILYFSTAFIHYAESTAEQMVAQVHENVENMLFQMESSARGLQKNEYVQNLLIEQDVSAKMELYNYVNQITDAIKTANCNIYSITWVRDDMRKISDPIREEMYSVQLLDQTYHFTSPDFKTPIYTGCIDDGTDAYSYGYIFPLFLYSSYKYPKIGCGIFQLDVRQLQELMNISNVTDNTLFLILDQNTRVVASNRTEISALDQEDLASLVSEAEHNPQMITRYSTVSTTGWTIVCRIPIRDLTGGLMRSVWVSILVLSLSLFIAVLFVKQIIQNITNPIQSIVQFLENTSADRLNQRMSIPENTDLAVIATNINQMMDRVESMTDKIVEHQAQLYESRLAEQEAELAALQSQINPHFLYNTLNCLNNIGLAYDIPQVSDISVSMSNIFRYSIKGNRTVYLREEMQCIYEYMRIMDIRFAGKFVAQYDIPEELLDISVPRMILQPVVENAVYHGLEPQNAKGWIRVHARIGDSCLYLSVKDNGKGMTAAQLAELQESLGPRKSKDHNPSQRRSIGLSNIHKRIQVRFGEEYGIQIESAENVGTEVTLKLPLLKKE